MKPSLRMNLSQHLNLTPQLQQAIRFMQLSTIDLKQEIQNIIESNPMLEAISEITEDEPQSNKEENEELNDIQWAQLFSSHNRMTGTDKNDYNLENLYSTTTTLRDHLQWQLNLTHMTDIDRVIGTTIIDAINDDGYLSQTLSEIHDSLYHKQQPIQMKEIEVVRHIIQNFDPVGCGSINISDCLQIQLKYLAEKIPYKELSETIIADDMEYLAHHNYQQLMKKYQVNEEVIHQVLSNIQKLYPKPGSLIFQNVTQYVIPDLLVKKRGGIWQVYLNPDTLPKLSINSQYAGLIKKVKNKSDSAYLKHHLQEAHWFLKSIQSRQNTLLNVAKCIVEYQQDFLEHGEEAMKPLILNDVAQKLGLHDSTISRATTQKYIHTPKGLFELKYFFSNQVGTSNGDEYSAKALQAILKKIIAEEDRKKPLSDNKIVALFKEKGIEIARRTVAKYREVMGIPSSHERKLFNY